MMAHGGNCPCARCGAEEDDYTANTSAVIEYAIELIEKCQTISDVVREAEEATGIDRDSYDRGETFSFLASRYPWLPETD
jgi:methylphosphotriester-DNA--protein-cysteine methyltransferase